MGQQLGGRIVVGVVLGVVAALGVTQPGASAEPVTSGASAQVADGSSSTDVEQYPTACPKPSDGSSVALLPQDPCEPPDPCADDSDGDGVSDCYDPCPVDPYDTCDDPPPTTNPPTTQPPTTQPPTTQPPTTQPPTTQPPVTSPPTVSPTVPPGTQPGCLVGCAYVRAVDLAVTRTKLKGTIDSTAQGCRSDAAVTVWLKKKGADRRLAVLTSGPTGTFRTARPARAGRYYVTVTSPEQPLCASVTSATVRVGHR